MCVGSSLSLMNDNKEEFAIDRTYMLCLVSNKSMISPIGERLTLIPMMLGKPADTGYFRSALPVWQTTHMHIPGMTHSPWTQPTQTAANENDAVLRNSYVL